MGTMNHEFYVSLELAKLLKQAGFDWHVKSCWDLSVDGDVWLNCDAIYPNNFRNNNEDIIYAPTLEVAQRWLREVKNIRLFVEGGNEYYTVESYICYKNCWCPTGICHNGLEYEHFNTYEKAQEAGIKKCLTLILEKDENN